VVEHDEKRTISECMGESFSFFSLPAPHRLRALVMSVSHSPVPLLPPSSSREYVSPSDSKTRVLQSVLPEGVAFLLASEIKVTVFYLLFPLALSCQDFYGNSICQRFKNEPKERLYVEGNCDRVRHENLKCTHLC